jgi:CubicO group peptidase (beta-lactamase class C family)
MMRTYESPHHSVVAFCLSGGAAGFLHSGVHLEDTPPEDVIFEIGSITKVFTGVLLCLLVEEGKVDPCAPRHAHSNLGVGLLGDAMAMRAGKPFMELLTETVIAPLGSKDTTDHLEQDRHGACAILSDKGIAASLWGSVRLTLSDQVRQAHGCFEAA